MTAEIVEDVLEKIDEIIAKQESLKGFKNETIELATENYEYKITKTPKFKWVRMVVTEAYVKYRADGNTAKRLYDITLSIKSKNSEKDKSKFTTWYRLDFETLTLDYLAKILPREKFYFEERSEVYDSIIANIYDKDLISSAYSYFIAVTDDGLADFLTFKKDDYRGGGQGADLRLMEHLGE
ncbi:hypothetical protein LW81_031 [Lactococcus phage LW81]|uniref:Uncharacterized protein n=1 Tax=Lactococcus phage LW81 TaxID=1965482 RepID=A0A1W6JMY4_9CAUD|nr:hypothetical protein H1Z34_gp031 [Lactococcus phage LW81]ARM67601.1 hypothetical protein LW81_031 [Lactococcus phage LW81]